MLSHLYIRNYAIIQELEVEFGNGLTIITGETGAGKSILIGALSLVLGKRADSSVLLDGGKKCVVEAEFQIEPQGFADFFAANDLDPLPATIVRREINAQGRSRAFINDTPVNLAQLKELARQLIDVHSQHEVLTLRSADFRTRFIDVCADGGKRVGIYRKTFGEHHRLRAKMDTLQESLRQSTQDEDYLRFQLAELTELDLAEGELERNQERLQMLENAEDIRGTLGVISETMLSGDNALIDGLKRVEVELRRLSKNLSVAEEWADRFKRSLIDLEDASEELTQKADAVEQDPEELQRVQDRVDEVIRLMTKHRKNSEPELIRFREELAARLDAMEHSDQQLSVLEKELALVDKALQTEADGLSDIRKTEAARMGGVLTAQMRRLGMPDAQVKIGIERIDPGPSGQDNISILFSANKGQPAQDISNVASGGELSRLMLCIKAEMADKTQLPAIIFDEVDTGVSGEIADKMGDKIKGLSTNMQVLCITHLPQIASKADQHLYVYKEEQEGRARAGVRVLDRSERIVEIAKLLSTANPTEAALTHARNMVQETRSIAN